MAAGPPHRPSAILRKITFTYGLGLADLPIPRSTSRSEEFQMLSCSTCWNSSRHQDGEAMLQEILDLGFERVELGHGIRLSLMEGIQRRFNKGGFTISS